jgi:Domain of unknown function (DUF4397)
MTRKTLVALMVGAFALLGVTPASAATGTYLRLAHLSPDTPTVDVLVTSFSGQTLRLDGVSYGNVSTYTEIAPGPYTLQMRPAGAPDSTPPVVSGTLDAVAGSAYTAAGLGPRDGLSVRVLTDDLARPGAGQSRIRVVQGAEQAGAVGIAWAGSPAFDDVAFGTATGYVTVPAGPGSFAVTPATGPAVQVPVRLDEGAIYSVILVQRDGALTARVTTDADGAGAVPTGGIETGLGGTAGIGLPGVIAGVAIIVLVLAVGGRRRAAR